jgi:hypothetical protein
MSVSGAGSGAAPEGGGEAQGEQQGGEATQQQAGLPEAFEQRFNDFEQRFGGVPDQISQLMDAFQGQGEEDPGGLQQEAQSPFILGADGQVYDLRTGALANPADLVGGEELTPEAIDQRIQERAEQIAQEAVAPLQAEQRAQQLAALEDSYPDLADPEKARVVVDEARRMAERIGAPEAWRDPEVLEQVYLAQQARERAEQPPEADAGQIAELEQPGAGRVQQPSESDIADGIVNAGGGGFWS